MHQSHWNHFIIKMQGDKFNLYSHLSSDSRPICFDVLAEVIKFFCLQDILRLNHTNSTINSCSKLNRAYQARCQQERIVPMIYINDDELFLLSSKKAGTSGGQSLVAKGPIPDHIIGFENIKIYLPLSVNFFRVYLFC